MYPLASGGREGADPSLCRDFCVHGLDLGGARSRCG